MVGSVVLERRRLVGCGPWSVNVNPHPEPEVRNASRIVIPTKVGIYFSRGYRPSPV